MRATENRAATLLVVMDESIGVQLVHRESAGEQHASRVMNGDGRTPGFGGFETGSTNTVLPDHPRLGPNHFVCREPIWATVARYALYVVFAGVVGYQAVVLYGMTPFAIFLLVIGVGLMAVLSARLSPRSIDFIGGSEGVYFPSRTRSGIGFGFLATPKTWLFVPWSNVLRISVGPLFDEWGATRGVTYCLRVSEDERREYFSTPTLPVIDGPRSAIQRGSILVGYRSVLRSPYKILAVLLRLRKAHAGV